MQGSLLSDPEKVGRIRRKMQEAYDYLLRPGRARPDGISGRAPAISIGGMPDI